jgi:acyl-CoA thioesterase
LEAVRRFFAADRYAAFTGAVITSVTDDEVVCELTLGELHRNAAGNVQGGAIFTLADLCFAVHCNLGILRGEDVGVTVGQSCSISYLKATRGTRLIARSRKLSGGRTMSVFEMAVSDDLGNPVAEMIGNAFTTGKK